MSVVTNHTSPAMYGFDNGNAPRFTAGRGYPPRQPEDVLAAQMAGLGFQDEGRGAPRGGGYGAQQQAAAFSPPPSAQAMYPSRQAGGRGQIPYTYARPQQPLQTGGGPLAAFTALNQKVSTAQQLARLNGWTLDEAVARLGGFSADEVRMLQAAASNNGAASLQQAQLAQQQALVAREEQLRHLQALQSQLVQQQAQNAAMQLPPPGSYDAQSLYQDAAGGRLSGAGGPGGDVASAYEQRQVAKQQLEANLKSRSSSRPPRTHTASPARSDTSAKRSGSPTASTASSRFEAGQAQARPKDTSSAASTKSSPKSSLGPGSAHSEQLVANRDSRERTAPFMPPASTATRPALSLAGPTNNAPFLSALASGTGNAFPLGFSVVVRQPRGPPAGADELGDANFASR